MHPTLTNVENKITKTIKFRHHGNISLSLIGKRRDILIAAPLKVSNWPHVLNVDWELLQGS